MKIIRHIAYCLVLVQLLLLFAACGPEEKPTTEGPTTGTPTTEAPTTGNKVEMPTTDGDEEESPYLYLVVDGQAQYTVITGTNAIPEVNEQVRGLIESLTSLTGATFRLETDMEAPSTDREILVCTSKHRDSVAPILREMTYTEYRVDVVDERIVLSTYSDHLDQLISYLLGSLYELEEGTWVCDREFLPFTSDSFSSSRAIPHYDSVKGALQGGKTYQSGHGGYTVSIEKTNAEEYAAYQEKLLDLGFAKYSENKIGLVDFVVYVNGRKTIYLQYNTSDLIKGPTVRITSTQDETLPSTTAEPYETLVDAKIIQPKIAGAEPYNNGMCTLFQLSDGSFIIVDGSIYVAEESAWMIDFIKSNTPAGMTPTVSLWLWTHAHGDHVGMPKRAMVEFKNAGIDLKAFGHNFPDWAAINESSATGKDIDSLISLAKQCYPDAVEWVMHAGQRMYIADAVIECIWSHEDVLPLRIAGLNDTDTVFSITIDGIRTMMLGDCENANSKMISWYQDELRSHVVQNAHHSINGPKLMYEYIDPIYSLWACTDEAMSENVSDHAEYLKATQWTRIDENGTTVTGRRIHYTNSRVEVILIKDIKAAYGNLK